MTLVDLSRPEGGPTDPIREIESSLVLYIAFTYFNHVLTLITLLSQVPFPDFEGVRGLISLTCEEFRTFARAARPLAILITGVLIRGEVLEVCKLVGGGWASRIKIRRKRQLSSQSI